MAWRTTELVWLLLAASACRQVEPFEQASPAEPEPVVTSLSADNDGDGYSDVAGDCDDADASVYPSAPELPGDDLDSDCDGLDRPTLSAGELADTAWLGSQMLANLGYAVDCLGDITGDGVPNVVLGEPDASSPLSTSTEGARVFVRPASDAGLIQLQGEQALVGELRGSLGQSVLILPDQDTDGVNELYIYGSELEEDILRTTWRVPNPSMTNRSLAALDDWLESEDDMLGRGYGRVGDLDQDGTEDLAVGAPANGGFANPGSVMIHWGLLAGPHLKGEGATFLRGTSDTNFFGAYVSGGDLDGDGDTDLLVSDAYSPSGIAHVFTGPLVRDVDLTTADAAIHVFPDDASEWPGEPVLVGDVNTDGIDDLLVGDWGYNAPEAHAGRVWVFFGPLSPGPLPLADAELTVVSTTPWDFFGVRLAVADYDGDGLHDLVVTAPSDPYHVVRVGRVHVFLGPFAPGTLQADEADVIFRTDWPGDDGGFSLAACDLDGDGASELLVGAREDSDGAGKVYRIGGRTGLSP